MGISGLLPALSPITKNIHIKEYSGKRVAIDGYSWLHKGSYSCSEEICLGKPTNKYIQYCLNLIRMLKQYNLTPVVIFDGGPLPNKKGKEDERYLHREEYKNKARAYLLEGNRTLANTCFQKAVDITPKMAFNLIKELRQMGIEYLVAPFEADAQLAFLALTGQVDAVITEDSDLIAYGTPNIIFKMDRTGYAQEIKIEDIASCNKGGYDFVDFNLTMLRHMCILSGCDYLPSLTGMGLKTAYKLIKQYRNIEAVFRHIKREKRIIITQDYEIMFNRADFTFKHQRVFDPVSKSLVTVLPLDKEYSEQDIFFIGPLMENRKAELISMGVIDPNSYEEFDKNCKLPTKPTFIVQPKKEIQKTQLNLSIRGGDSKKQFNNQKVDHFAANKITNYFSPIQKQNNDDQDLQLDIVINDSDLEFDSPQKKKEIKNNNNNNPNSIVDDEFVLDSDYEDVPSSDDEYYSIKSPNNSSTGSNSSSVKKKKQFITNKFFNFEDEEEIEEKKNNIYNNGFDESDDEDKIIGDSGDEMVVEDSDTSFEVPQPTNFSKKNNNNNNNYYSNGSNSNSGKSQISPPTSSSTLLTQERVSLNFLQQFEFNGKKKDSILFTSTKNQSNLSNSLSLSMSNNSVNSNNNSNNNNKNSKTNSTNSLKFSNNNSNFNSPPVNNLQPAFINSLDDNNKKRSLSEIEDNDFSSFTSKKKHKPVNKSQPTTPTSSQNSSNSSNSNSSLRKSSTDPSLVNSHNRSEKINVLDILSENEKCVSTITTITDDSPTKIEILEQEKSLNNFHINSITTTTTTATTTIATNNNSSTSVTTSTATLTPVSNYGNSSAAILSKYFSGGASSLLKTPTKNINNNNNDSGEPSPIAPAISPSVNFKSRLLWRAKQAMSSQSND